MSASERSKKLNISKTNESTAFQIISINPAPRVLIGHRERNGSLTKLEKKFEGDFMKKLNLVVLGLLALSSAAQAMVPPMPRTASVTGGEIDPNFGIPAGPLSGNVTVDPASRTISLYVQSGRQVAVCLAIGCVPPMPTLQAELPIVSSKQDHCGVVTYVAKKDRRPLDGSYERIVLRDYSQMTCRYMTEAMTVVQYNTITSGFGATPVLKTRSQILADVLSNGFDVIRPLPFEIDGSDTSEIDETIAE